MSSPSICNMLQLALLGRVGTEHVGFYHHRSDTPFQIDRGKEVDSIPHKVLSVLVGVAFRPQASYDHPVLCNLDMETYLRVVCGCEGRRSGSERVLVRRKFQPSLQE